jgi:hypothetical protein
MVKTLGYVLFGICCISFLAILIVPLMGLSGKQIAGTTIALVIVGEVTFYLSLILLGKAFYNKIREKLKFRKSKLTGKTDSEQPEEIK